MNFLKTTLVGALLTTGLLASVAHADTMNSKPNFVIILADDLGHGDLGYTGSLQIKTPNIDALAKSGMIIDQGYVSAPVCGPSRAGLMTGRNQVNFGIGHNNVKLGKQYKAEYFGLPLTEKTIADRLAEQGYVNGLMGKWHLGDEEHFNAENRGFDDVWTYPHGGHDYFKSNPKSKKRYLSELRSNFKKPEKITYLTDDTGNESVEFIRRHKDKPFFLYASFNAPHTPLQAKEEDMALYKHIKNKARRTYAAMVHCLDVNVGKIIQELKAQGVYENTVVVFLSDNGGPIKHPSKAYLTNSPYRGTKGILLEGGIRVPFVFSWPGKIKANSHYPEPVISLDLAPTFLELAGGKIKPKDKFDGVNIYPYLTGQKKGEARKNMMWDFVIGSSIREGDWKLIRLPDRLPMLYNVKEDVSELHDMASQHPDKVKALLKTLGNWNISTPNLMFMEGAGSKRAQQEKYDATYNLVQPKN